MGIFWLESENNTTKSDGEWGVMMGSNEVWTVWCNKLSDLNPLSPLLDVNESVFEEPWTGACGIWAS